MLVEGNSDAICSRKCVAAFTPVIIISISVIIKMASLNLPISKLQENPKKVHENIN